MSLLIKNGKVFFDGNLSSVDVLLEKGYIKEISDNIQDSADKIIDAAGKIILPGIIDVHVHFRDFGQEEKGTWESESRAAAAGGVTTVLDMPNNKTPISTEKLLEVKRQHVRENSLVNFGLYMIVNNDNIEEVNSTKNIPGVKLYMGMTTGGNSVQNIEDIFKRIRKDILIVVHAESNKIMDENKKIYTENTVEVHSKIRDNKSEYEAVAEVLDYTEKYKTKVHFAHISTKESLKLIKEAKDKGIDVTCEVCPHHMFLDINDYGTLGNFAKMNPSLKSENDRIELMKAIKSGVVDMIATDHAPHIKSEKEQDYFDCPSGVTGVETSLPLVFDMHNKGILNIKTLVKLMSENPAKRFKIKGRGEIKPGYSADLVIIDPELEKEIKNENLYTKVKWSPYDGAVVKGWPMFTIINGNVVFDNGTFFDEVKGEEVNIG